MLVSFTRFLPCILLFIFLLFRIGSLLRSFLSTLIQYQLSNIIPITTTPLLWLLPSLNSQFLLFLIITLLSPLVPNFSLPFLVPNALSSLLPFNLFFHFVFQCLSSVSPSQFSLFHHTSIFSLPDSERANGRIMATLSPAINCRRVVILISRGNYSLPDARIITAASPPSCSCQRAISSCRAVAEAVGAAAEPFRSTGLPFRPSFSVSPFRSPLSVSFRPRFHSAIRSFDSSGRCFSFVFVWSFFRSVFCFVVVAVLALFRFTSVRHFVRFVCSLFRFVFCMVVVLFPVSHRHCFVPWTGSCYLRRNS